MHTGEPFVDSPHREDLSTHYHDSCCFNSRA
jgi:hypothetical protein